MKLWPSLICVAALLLGSARLVLAADVAVNPWFVAGQKAVADARAIVGARTRRRT